MHAAWARRLTWANLALTAFAFVVLGLTLLFRLRGGAEHPIVDLFQFAAAWGYILMTPLLAIASLVQRRGSKLAAWPSLVLLGVWLGLIIAGFFIHG
jgi:hypothetical protein